MPSDLAQRLRNEAKALAIGARVAITRQCLNPGARNVRACNAVDAALDAVIERMASQLDSDAAEIERLRGALPAIYRCSEDPVAAILLHVSNLETDLASARAAAPTKVGAEWQLVPKVPTEAMLRAAHSFRGALQQIPLERSAYAALLAAAPTTPPDAQGDER